MSAAITTVSSGLNDQAEPASQAATAPAIGSRAGG
jgi:hypothetical protein